MENNARPPHPLADSGLLLAPIHPVNDATPLRVCIVVRSEPDPAAGPFALLRELPGARVYWGAVCDAEARIQEWVEVWVQSIELRDLAFSGYQETLTNFIFDQRWRLEYDLCAANLPETVIVTGMEMQNPSPMLIRRRAAKAGALFVPVEPTAWQLCKDDALLSSFGLPPYSTSPFRYLHEPGATGAKTFLATAEDSPANAHVQGLERLKAGPDVTEIFNPHAGLIRVNRLSPLGLEEYLQILEGRPWQAVGPGTARLFQDGVYGALQTWSASPKGMPFLLHSKSAMADRLNEVFFLKLSALLGMFKAVRTAVASAAQSFSRQLQSAA
jgi:hypothetical protein